MTTLNLPDSTTSYNTETTELLKVTYSVTCALQPAAERQREQAKRRERGNVKIKFKNNGITKE